ncbi:MAG: AAA family ATPase, partial [Acutalibacteraceae bacterium]
MKRLEKVTEMMSTECELLSIEKKIDDRVRQSMDENQHDYYLREQMRTIAEELGEADSPYTEAEDYKDRILNLKLDDEITDKLIKEAEKLYKMPSGSQEGTVIRNYLDAVLDLPWHKKSKEKTDIDAAKKLLDKEHYGLDKVKDRILELIAVRRLDSNVKGQIICLVGPPGVGKTSIAKSLAKCMNRKYQRISLGGVHDEAEIRGH